MKCCPASFPSKVNNSSSRHVGGALTASSTEMLAALSTGMLAVSSTGMASSTRT